MSLTVLISFIHGLLLFSVTALHLLVTEETTKLATRLWTRRSTKQQMRVLPPQELVENVQVDFTMNDVWKWNWNVFSHVRCNSFIKVITSTCFSHFLCIQALKFPIRIWFFSDGWFNKLRSKQCPAGPGIKVSGTVSPLNNTAETSYKNQNWNQLK